MTWTIAERTRRGSLTMRLGRLLIVVIALSTLAGCVPHYHMPRESEPHATLVFDKGKGIDERPMPLKLNGGGPTYRLMGFANRRTFRIGLGTMRLELGECPEGDLFSAGPSFTCELSFEAEAGRRYLVTMRGEDDYYLYAVTADNGTKVAGCKAQEACEMVYGVHPEQIEDCPIPPVPGGQGKGEGAIVIREDAPVYKRPNSTGVAWELKRGDAVAAIEPKGRLWQFYEDSGRVRIAFLYEGDHRLAWMRLEDLAKFTYDFCVFPPRAGHSTPPPGNPFTTGKREKWNVCFQEARDAKLKELRATWAEE